MGLQETLLSIMKGERAREEEMEEKEKKEERESEGKDKTEEGK